MDNDRRSSGAELSFSEQTLQDQSSLLMSILNSMGDGVIVLDGQARFRLFNPRAREIFGIGCRERTPAVWTDDWTRRYGLEFYLPDAEGLYPVGQLPFLRALRGETVDRAEVRLRRASSAETVWLSITARPLVDDEGCVRGSVTIVRDITARKLAEHAVKRSESLYRSLADHLPLYLLRKDIQGRFTFVNDNLCQLLGRSREEIVGKTDYDFYPHELADKYVRDDREVIRRGTIFRDVEAHRAADGSVRHVEVLKTPVHGAQGEVVETQTVFLDVTDRAEAERRLVQSARLAAIGEMVTGVAHESRNALQQIQACNGLLRHRLRGDEEAGALIEDLQKALDRLLRLFEDLRGYAAPVALELRPCNVGEVLAEAWSALAPLREGRDATLRQLGSLRDAQCLADSLRLQQVFRNILENALAACEDPAVIEVETTDGRIGGSAALRIVFRDHGPGFTAEQQQRAFEPFYTTKATGTGLGLGIAKRFIEAHHGEVTLGNRRTGGAEISITLPRGEI